MTHPYQVGVVQPDSFSLFPVHGRDLEAPTVNDCHAFITSYIPMLISALVLGCAAAMGERSHGFIIMGIIIVEDPL